MGFDMLVRACENGVPYSFVTADSLYGDYTEIRRWLESEGKGYVMALSGKAYVERKPIKKWIEETTSSGWRIIIGEGSKWQRCYEWK